METKAPSSMASEISDKARWSWRPEVRKTCETRSISIMAAACLGDSAASTRASGRDGNTFIPALLPGIGPLGAQGFPINGLSIAETCKFWRCRFATTISLGTGSPEHRAYRRRVETAQFQRQRYQFVVAWLDLGQHKILDNSKIVPLANHM